MKIIINYLILFAITFAALSCEGDFTPYTELEHNYFIYCVLDNRLNTQVAVAQKFYLLGTNKNMPPNTRLILSENKGYNYSFRDTVINGNTNFSYYYLPNFILKRDAEYRLTILTDSMELQYGELVFYKNPALSQMRSYIEIDKVQIPGYTFQYSNNNSEYNTFKIYIDYEIKRVDSVQKSKKEVPVRIFSPKKDPNDIGVPTWTYDYADIYPSYPGILKKNELPDYIRSKNGDRYYYFFSDDAFYYTLRFLNPKETSDEKIDSSNISIKRAYIVFYSIDKNIYEKMTAITQTSYSIRLDDPIYWTNIRTEDKNGFGFFGAFAADTVLLKLEDNMISKFGYKNEQKK